MIAWFVVEVLQLLCIPLNYGFILQQLQNIALMQGSLPLQTKEQLWVDWCLRGKASFLQVITNLLYY